MADSNGKKNKNIMIRVNTLKLKTAYFVFQMTFLPVKLDEF